MPRKEKAPAPVERYLDAIDNAILYRYPHVVGPPMLAAAALGVCAAAHQWAGDTGLIIGAVVLGVTLLLGLDSALRLPEIRERIYAGGCWVAGIGWCAAAGWFGPGWRTPGGTPALLCAWGCVLVLGWLPWFKHRRIRRAVDVAKEIGAFDGDAIGLKGVTLSKAGAKADEHGWVAPVLINIPGSYTLDMLSRSIPRVAARMNCEPHSLSFERVRGDKEGKYQLRRDYGTRDPEGMHFEVPAEPTTMRKPFPVGLLSDQKTPMKFEVWRAGHGGVDCVMAGQKGMGKSTAYKRIGIQTVASQDGLLIIGDMKPGSPDYDVLARGAYAYARTAEEIDVVIEALHILCEVRGRNKRKDRKIIVGQFDETSLYFSPSLPDGNRAAATEAARQDTRRRARWETLCAISRAFDMSLSAATQRCEPQTIGGNNARAALLAGGVVGFYSPKGRDSSLLSSDGAITMHTLPRGRKGECWISNQVHGSPVRGRWHNVTDEQVEQTVTRFADLEKDLHDDELAALRDGLGEAWERLRAACRPTSDPKPKPKPKPAAPVAVDDPDQSKPAAVATPGESRLLVWDALARLGNPASVSEIAAEAGRSLSLVRARLVELEAVGCVIREGVNRWTRYLPATDPRALASGPPVPANGPPAGTRL